MAISKLLHSDIGKIFSGNFTIQISTILQAIIISRILGPDGKGEFIEIILWPTIISGFSILGLYTAIAKLCARNIIFSKYNFAKTSLIVTSITGLIGTIISLILSPILVAINDKDTTLCVLVFSFFVLINNIARGFNAIDHGRKEFTVYSITRAILNPIFFVFILLLYIFNHINLFSIIACLLFSNFIVCIIRAIFSLRRERFKKNVYPIKKLLNYSLSFSISDFSEPIYAYYDKAILALLLCSYDLGLYTTAYSAAGVISILSNVYGTKIFSDLASKAEIDIITFKIRQNIILMSISGLILAALIPLLIPIIFGNDFIPAIIPAILLIIVCIIQGQSYIIERGLLGMGYPFAGIKSKIGSMIILAITAFSLKVIDYVNLYSIISVVAVSQLLYFIILRKKLKDISNIPINIVPNISDFKYLIDKIFKD